MDRIFKPEHQTETPRPETRGQLIHWAANYDRMVTVLTLGREGRFRRRILDAARLAPGGRVLDVGCGTGTLALLAAESVGSNGRVDGIDPSPEMIARARSKADRSEQSVHFQEAGIESLPFRDRSFDVVLSSLMFHHLDSSLQEAGLREILRVLAPGGRLTIIDFAGRGPLLHRLAAHFAHHKSDHEAHGDEEPFERIRAMAAGLGYRNITTSSFGPRVLRRLSADAALDG